MHNSLKAHAPDLVHFCGGSIYAIAVVVTANIGSSIKLGH